MQLVLDLSSSHGQYFTCGALTAGDGTMDGSVVPFAVCGLSGKEKSVCNGLSERSLRAFASDSHVTVGAAGERV